MHENSILSGYVVLYILLSWLALQGNIRKLGYIPFHGKRLLKGIVSYFHTSFYRLGQVKLGYVIAPQGQVIGPAGLEIGESYCENTTKRPLRGVASKVTIPKKGSLKSVIMYSQQANWGQIKKSLILQTVGPKRQLKITYRFRDVFHK